MSALDLSAPRCIHIVGIGGAGMSGIATVLAEQGHRVRGTDQVESATLLGLRDAGIDAVVGHDAAQLVEGTDAVLVSTAVPADHPEVLEANRRGIAVLSRTESLGPITAGRSVIAVAGTHGKTTTTSMLVLVLSAAGVDPGFLVGARITSLARAAGWGSAPWFALEADESDGSFMAARRAACIVTNVEADHLEHHGSLESLRSAFGEFVVTTDGPVVLCADDPGSAALAPLAAAAGRHVTTYGEHPDADVRIVDLESSRGEVRWTLRRMGRPDLRLAVAAPGLHHALDATAAAVVAAELGIDDASIVTGLSGYGGVARRFEHRGEVDGVTFVDDYAHLPTEVAAVLAGARSGGWPRIVAVFQPHRYSRTEALWAEFADAFVDADLLVLTDVYPAGEPARPGVSGHLILAAVLDAHPRAHVAYVPRLDDVTTYLRGVLRPGDLCLSIGAGDVTRLADAMARR